MKKFPVLLLLLSFAIVGCKSNEEKAADLIKKELSKSLFDFESYSPIETTVTEAKHSIFTDTAFFKSANTILFALNVAKEALESVSEAEEGMNLWGKPTYSSSSYSDKKYYKYKEEYDECIEKFFGTWLVIKSMEKDLKDTLQTIDPEKVVGWEVIHKFRCKTKGGYSSIANYRYIIDNNFKKVLLYEDMEGDDYEKLRVVINRVVNEGLTTDDL